jgi:hypothetical protein
MAAQGWANIMIGLCCFLVNVSMVAQDWANGHTRLTRAIALQKVQKYSQPDPFNLQVHSTYALLSIPEASLVIPCARALFLHVGGSHIVWQISAIFNNDFSFQ